MNLTLFAGGGLWVRDVTSRIQHNSDRADRRIERAEYGVCGRVQRLRANTNRNSATLYAGIRAFASDQHQSLLTRRRLLELVRVPRYQPPTNCNRAVDHPDTYRASPPVPVADLSASRRRQLLHSGR
jgi:hypothetical protein